MINIINLLKSQDLFPFQIKCGVSFHPSHPPIFGMINEVEEDRLKAVKCPQLLLPAGNDSDTVKTDGLAQKVLGKDKCDVIEFPDMVHGWSVRGDCSKPGTLTKSSTF